MFEPTLRYIIYNIISNLGIYLVLIIFGLKILSLLKSRIRVLQSQHVDDVCNISTLSIRTKEFHQFLKFLIIETTVIEFQKFKMNNDMTKLSRTVIQQLIGQISTEVFESFKDTDPLKDRYNLLTEKYYMKYISDIAIVTIDKLMDGAIEDITIIN
jgi:hypothetical protein